MRSISGLGVKDVLPLGALVRALLTFVAVADAFLSLQIWLLHPQPHHHHTAGEVALLAFASMRLAGAIMLAAAALYLATRPKRAFRRILLLLAVFAALMAMAASQPALVAIAAVDCLAALLASSLWPEVSDRRASRLGWSLLGGAVAATAWLFLLQQPDRRMSFLFTLVLALALVAVVSALALLDRNPPLPAAQMLPTALALYRSHAHSGVSPFALMRDKRHFAASDLRSFLPFACSAGSALALGPGIGDAASAARLEVEFRRAARLRGWRPAFYQVSEEVAARMHRTLRLAIGGEAVVDLPGFGLEGSAMAKLRHDVARARRQGVEVRVSPERELDGESRLALEQLDRQSRHDRRLGEMTFSVGRRDDPATVERTFGLAYDRDGRLAAYVTWLWVPASQTMVLDEVKRDHQAPSGAVDFLIFSCLERFKGQAARASLGLAPLTGARYAAGLAVVESSLRFALGISSLSPGLYSFKAKFAPRWERRYLVVERVFDLPAVLTATLLLHYPGLVPALGSLGRLSVRRRAGGLVNPSEMA
ncbi:MAG: hypothetical protein DLM67_02785 [Candidatus Nephthysia bennettiae]|uniref:DUF2156 domain-containing protein n=1 Tax=Candidatus Nephthysia bennettiae TaxID=3127016 RepID=A0A934N2F2_9BACT|nr:DUF2156 domain-containing protein [Candidatus Dormibacteraeota bacterium]MBJ7614302.1 DUF2156 domain-containing protein [Candidatus Dormibacteraeota bacterium]PZR99837.1 MAG: hypothetical protein DLM67_02785 [Candidatus Dormibacteraeota bacterium]